MKKIVSRAFNEIAFVIDVSLVLQTFSSGPYLINCGNKSLPRYKSNEVLKWKQAYIKRNKIFCMKIPLHKITSLWVSKVFLNIVTLLN